MRAASRLPDQCFSLRHSGGHYRRPVTAVMGPQGALGSLALPGAKLALSALPHDPHAHPPPTTTSENCMWRAWRAPHSLGGPHLLHYGGPAGSLVYSWPDATLRTDRLTSLPPSEGKWRSQSRDDAANSSDEASRRAQSKVGSVTRYARPLRRAAVLLHP